MSRRQFGKKGAAAPAEQMIPEREVPTAALEEYLRGELTGRGLRESKDYRVGVGFTRRTRPEIAVAECEGADVFRIFNMVYIVGWLETAAPPIHLTVAGKDQR